MPSNYLGVVGIGTDIGKTLVSSILVRGLNYAYWKPIQAGVHPETDTQAVKRLTELQDDHFIPETYVLPEPLSPHASAAIAGIEIEVSKLQLPIIPAKCNGVLIEGAGGLMVPITSAFLFSDLFQQWQVPVVLVSRNYLGSINHTLLSAEHLKHKNIPVKGIIFNGVENPSSEKVIEKYTGFKVLGRIPEVEKITPQWIAEAFKKYISW